MNQPTTPLPPPPDDEGAYIYIDHREEEASIAFYVGERLHEAHVLEVDEDDEQLSIVFQGQAYPVPLSFSMHDRYIMVSSLAAVLSGHYRFFLLRPTLSDDTHGLLVAPHAQVDAWGELPEHLLPLELGVDYFNKVRVPYWGAEDSAPGLDEDRARIEREQGAMAALVEAMLTGKLTDEAIGKLASVVQGHPGLPEELANKSRLDIVAELQEGLKDIIKPRDE